MWRSTRFEALRLEASGASCGARADAELRVDLREVRLDRADADEQPRGDLLVREALGDELGDAPLASRSAHRPSRRAAGDARELGRRLLRPARRARARRRARAPSSARHGRQRGASRAARRGPGRAACGRARTARAGSSCAASAASSARAPTWSPAAAAISASHRPAMASDHGRRTCRRRAQRRDDGLRVFEPAGADVRLAENVRDREDRQIAEAVLAHQRPGRLEDSDRLAPGRLPPARPGRAPRGARSCTRRRPPPRQPGATRSRARGRRRGSRGTASTMASANLPPRSSAGSPPGARARRRDVRRRERLRSGRTAAAPRRDGRALPPRSASRPRSLGHIDLLREEARGLVELRGVEMRAQASTMRGE